MSKSLKVTGKITLADGATDHASFGLAATKQTLSISEISIDMQVERQQTRVEDAAGGLEVGDSYILFAAMRIGFKGKRTSLGAFLAFLQGTAAAVADGYIPLTMAVAAAKNRSGAAKLALYHPTLGASVPAIITPATGVLRYQALAPDSALTAGVESEGEFAFMMDVPSGQTLHIHESLAAEITALT